MINLSTIAALVALFSAASAQYQSMDVVSGGNYSGNFWGTLGRGHLFTLNAASSRPRVGVMVGYVTLPATNEFPCVPLDPLKNQGYSLLCPEFDLTSGYRPTRVFKVTTSPSGFKTLTASIIRFGQSTPQSGGLFAHQVYGNMNETFLSARSYNEVFTLTASATLASQSSPFNLVNRVNSPRLAGIVGSGSWRGTLTYNGQPRISEVYIMPNTSLTRFGDALPTAGFPFFHTASVWFGNFADANVDPVYRIPQCLLTTFQSNNLDPNNNTASLFCPPGFFNNPGIPDGVFAFKIRREAVATTQGFTYQLNITWDACDFAVPHFACVPRTANIGTLLPWL